MNVRPRFERGVYRDCKWCGGRGCLSCPVEAEREYRRQFPDGPQPLLTISREELAASDEQTLKADYGALGEILAMCKGLVPAAEQTAKSSDDALTTTTPTTP